MATSRDTVRWLRAEYRARFRVQNSMTLDPLTMAALRKGPSLTSADAASRGGIGVQRGHDGSSTTPGAVASTAEMHEVMSWH